MNRSNLTPKQAAVYRLIVAGYQSGCVPTIATMAASLHTSKPTLHERVETLIRKGYVRRDRYKARSLRPIKPIDGRYAADAVSSSIIDLMRSLRASLVVATGLCIEHEVPGDEYRDRFTDDIARIDAALAKAEGFGIAGVAG